MVPEGNHEIKANIKESVLSSLTQVLSKHDFYKMTWNQRCVKDTRRPTVSEIDSDT